MRGERLKSDKSWNLSVDIGTLILVFLAMQPRGGKEEDEFNTSSPQYLLVLYRVVNPEYKHAACG
jgi:hypothetical protein